MTRKLCYVSFSGPWSCSRPAELHYAPNFISVLRIHLIVKSEVWVKRSMGLCSKSQQREKHLVLTQKSGLFNPNSTLKYKVSSLCHLNRPVRPSKQSWERLHVTPAAQSGFLSRDSGSAHIGQHLHTAVAMELCSGTAWGWGFKNRSNEISAILRPDICEAKNTAAYCGLNDNHTGSNSLIDFMHLCMFDLL